MTTMIEVGQNILIGLLSGILSGVIVYWITKWREEKREIYYYWYNYLFRVMEHCKVYIPSEELSKVSEVGEKGSKWYSAISEILEETNPYEIEDREFDEHEERIAKNTLIALNELNAWKKKNRLR